MTLTILQVLLDSLAAARLAELVDTLCALGVGAARAAGDKLLAHGEGLAGVFAKPLELLLGQAQQVEVSRPLDGCRQLQELLVLRIQVPLGLLGHLGAATAVEPKVKPVINPRTSRSRQRSCSFPLMYTKGKSVAATVYCRGHRHSSYQRSSLTWLGLDSHLASFPSRR